mmetsp:Transcript_1647/g.3383  ORF Transcript_1647/g.3383 Transcript_1647/m.3383 type:complete len:230 (-) Transcript_1647:403-1092(-)
MANQSRVDFDPNHEFGRHDFGYLSKDGVVLLVERRFYDEACRRYERAEQGNREDRAAGQGNLMDFLDLVKHTSMYKVTLEDLQYNVYDLCERVDDVCLLAFKQEAVNLVELQQAAHYAKKAASRLYAAPTHIALKSMEDQTSFYKDTFKMKAAPPMSSAHNRLRNAALDLRADAKAVRGVDSKFVQPYVKAARVVDKGAPGNFFAFFFENPQFRLVQDSVEFGVRPRQE